MGIMIIGIIVALVLVYIGITTGVLWTLLGGLFSLIGSCIWELLKAIGSGIGALLGNILAGTGNGVLAFAQAVALPVLAAGAIVFVGVMIWKAFFS